MTTRRGRAAVPVDRRGARPAPGGVPRRHDLEDPVPREPGPARPRAHAVGLPEVLRGRRRAAALDPRPAARELPAAQGDQGPPGGGDAGRRPSSARRCRRARPSPLAAVGRQPAGAGRRPHRRLPAAPTAAPWPRRPTRRAARRATGGGGSAPSTPGPTRRQPDHRRAGRRRRARRARRRASSSVLRAARRPHVGRRGRLRRRRPGRRPARRRLPRPASSRGTCACSRWPPSGRPASTSSSSCPLPRQRNPEARAAGRRPPRRARPASGEQLRERAAAPGAAAIDRR